MTDCVPGDGGAVRLRPGGQPAADRVRGHLHQQRAGRSAGLRADHRLHPLGHERHPAAQTHLRYLPGQPDPGPGVRRDDLQDEVRQQRHEPALHLPAHHQVLYHQPEPRLRGGLDLAAVPRLEDSLPERQRPLQRGHHPHLQALSFFSVQFHPEACGGPARTTPSSSSAT